MEQPIFNIFSPSRGEEPKSSESPSKLPEILDIKKQKEWTTSPREWGHATLASYSVLVGDQNKDDERKSHYIVTTGWTHDDDSLLDASLIRGNPMMTRNSGSTYARMLNSIRAGFPTDHIGPSDQTLSLRTMGAHEIAINSAITDKLAGRVPRRKDAILINGESRHAAITFATAWQAAEQGVDVLDMESAAPCFAETRGMVHNFIRTVRFMGREGLSAVGMFMENPCHMMENTAMLLPDMDLTNRYLGDAWMLQSGQAGYAAKHMPHTTPGRVVLYQDDHWSYPREWQKIFGGARTESEIEAPTYPNLVVETRPGSHTTLGDKREVQEHGQRLYQLADRYRTNKLAA